MIVALESASLEPFEVRILPMTTLANVMLEDLPLLRPEARHLDLDARRHVEPQVPVQLHQVLG